MKRKKKLMDVADILQSCKLTIKSMQENQVNECIEKNICYTIIKDLNSVIEILKSLND